MQCEPYFKGVITFSRAKITLREVTQGKAESLTYRAALQPNPVNIPEAFGCLEICKVLSGKQFMDGRTPGRSQSPRPLEFFLSLPEILQSNGSIM